MSCLDATTVAEREAAARSIANLATSAGNQSELASCIPRLCELAVGFDVAGPEHGCRCMALQALQNMSLSDEYHEAITAPPHPASATVIEALTRPSLDRELTLRALRVLVNLASNAEMAPFLVNGGVLPALSETIARHGMDDVDVLRKVLTAAAYVATDHRAAAALEQAKAPLCEQLVALQVHPDDEVRAWAIKAYGLIFATVLFHSPGPGAEAGSAGAALPAPHG